MPQVTVIPVLQYDDVPTVARWLCETFGFAVRWEAGTHRAQLVHGTGAIAITERANSPGGTETNDQEGVSSSNRASRSELMVRIEDVDAHFEFTRGKGVTILAAPKDFPYGERQYTVLDLGGNRWTFSQTIADVPPEDWGGTSVNLDA
ncbi:MAG: VOC family protein [Thermoplasmata archaeon]|nr:VOC family protein [Thermoplasmata archaeon]